MFSFLLIESTFLWVIIGAMCQAKFANLSPFYTTYTMFVEVSMGYTIRARNLALSSLDSLDIRRTATLAPSFAI
jgi:hypothetical protein